MRYRVTASALNLRSGPGTEYPVLEALPRGTRLEAARAGWERVRVGDRTGWVASQHIEETEPDPAWLAIARLELGVAEVPGEDHSDRILEYHWATSLKATADEVPWCAAFACWCLEKASIDSPRSAAARDFLRWGVEIAEPRPGCLVVLKRGALEWQGHVTFFDGWSRPGQFYGLGGNQSNQVNVQIFGTAGVLGYRWPVEPSPAEADALAA